MTPTPASREALIGLSPDDLILYALEITHPDLADAVRVVADGRAREIEGQTYMALAFSVRLARDEERRAPRAELRIDNAGRDIMIWLDRAGGGQGVGIRVMRCLADGDTAAQDPDWEAVFDVLLIRADQQSVTAIIGYDPLLDRPAVGLRHDPETSPALF